MHRAPCISEALQLRQRVRNHLARGVYHRTEVALPAGTADAELCQHASLETSAAGQQLVLRDLRTGQVASRWPLPAALADCSFELGNAKWTGSLLAVAHDAASGQDAGVLLVDVITGACTRAELDAVEVCMEWAPLLSEWSSSGCLLLHRLHEEDDACTFRAVDRQGRLIQTASFPRNTTWLRPDCWGPADGHAVLHQDGTTWTWQPERGGLPVQSELNSRPSYCAWCPDSCSLLNLFGRGGGSIDIRLWTSSCYLELQPIPGYPSGVLWGGHGHVVILYTTRPVGKCGADYDSHVAFCQAPDSATLNFVHTHTDAAPVPYGCTLAGRALAPDLLLCSIASRHSIAVLTVDGGLRQDIKVPFEAWKLAWAADSSRLVVSDRGGTQHVLLEALLFDRSVGFPS